MLDVLAENVLLTLFVVIALGTIFGAVPFGPVKFGAAGALFVGLLVGAVIPAPAADLVIFQDLGLGLFVYLVGLEAGETFFKEFRRQFGLMVTAVVSVLLAAAASVLAGGLLGVAREITTGVFAGALTNTPSLALAQQLTVSTAPAVGYSIGYPTGVVVAILIVSLFIGRDWKASKDQVDPDDAILQVARVAVSHPMTVRERTTSCWPPRRPIWSSATSSRSSTPTTATTRWRSTSAIPSAASPRSTPSRRPAAWPWDSPPP